MSAPSGYTALDFVGFTDKGTYSPSATYMRNDLVHYGGNIMRCLIDNTTNVTPVVGANWELWVGASANLVERVIAPLENNPADVAYGVGRQIIYDDWLWEVIAPIAVGDALVDYAVDPINANIKKSAPVETQLLAVKAEADATDNMIAPTETNASSSSAAYAVGDQLILNNVLYTVTTAITIGDALVSGTGGNIEASDSLTDQLANKADDSALATVAKTGAYSDLSGKPTLGTAAAKASTNAVTQNSTDLVESGAVYSEVNTVKQALTTQSANLAPIEDGTNYSTSYSKGRQFIHNGLLCEVTASSVNSSTAINVGSSGNAKYVDSVTKQIFNCFKKYTGFYNDKIRVSRFGNLVYIYSVIGADFLVTGGELTLGTLASDYIPSHNVWISCGAELDPAILKINTDGTVILKTARTTSFYLALSAVYNIQGTT